MKASYANMKLKINLEVKTFEFAGQKIEVLQYLPVDDKYDLLMITLQEALENNIYNDFKLNFYFELNLVYMYTNISFTEKQREDESKIYDNLKSNGFFDLFFKNFNQNEYDELFEQLQELKNSLTLRNTNIAMLISELITELPKNAEAAAKIVDSFNPEKYQEVINFAKSANGGRDIV